MFPLGGDRFPQSQVEFEFALNAGLEILGSCPGIVEISGPNFPDLERLSLDISGAGIPSSPLQAPQIRGTGTTTAGVRVQSFSVRAYPFHLPESEAAISIEARNVALDFGRNESGAPVLELSYAEHGTIEVSLAKSSLESLVAALARKAAAKKEVPIERTEVEINADGPRSLTFLARVAARKMGFSVEINVTGRLEIDESLTARLSDLDCNGEGIVNAGACELLRPQLAKADGLTIPLAALPIENVKLHDVRLQVGDHIRIEAVFGRS